MRGCFLGLIQPALIQVRGQSHQSNKVRKHLLAKRSCESRHAKLASFQIFRVIPGG
jgi:hypothetical protein